MRDILTIFVILLVLLLLISTLGGSIRFNENFANAEVEYQGHTIQHYPPKNFELHPYPQPEHAMPAPQPAIEATEQPQERKEPKIEDKTIPQSELNIEAFDGTSPFAAI